MTNIGNCWPLTRCFAINNFGKNSPSEPHKRQTCVRSNTLIESWVNNLCRIFNFKYHAAIHHYKNNHFHPYIIAYEQQEKSELTAGIMSQSTNVNKIILTASIIYIIDDATVPYYTSYRTLSLRYICSKINRIAA